MSCFTVLCVVFGFAFVVYNCKCIWLRIKRWITWVGFKKKKER